MLNFVKVISTQIDDLQRRVVKHLRYGKSDVQTSLESSPAGLDSNPPKNMIAVYGIPTTAGKTVVLGYLNIKQLSDVGETRMFSTDKDGGEIKTYVWLKNDGTMEIGGNADFMVRYSKLEEAFNELKDKFNTFANSYVAGGPAVQGLPAAVQPSTADISGAKIEEIKTR